MTVILELAPEEEAQLQANAAQKGLPTEAYVLTALRHEFERDAQAKPTTLKKQEGSILSKPDFARFVTLIEYLQPPTQELRNAMEEYRRAGM